MCILLGATITDFSSIRLDESAQLQEAVEQTLEQKQLLEAQATEQAQLLTELETARQDLEKANKSLNSRIEALERDNKLAKTTLPISGASAGDAAGRAKLEEQLAQANKELEEAKEELARISMAESMQRMSVWVSSECL